MNASGMVLASNAILLLSSGIRDFLGQFSIPKADGKTGEAKFIDCHVRRTPSARLETFTLNSKRIICDFAPLDHVLHTRGPGGSDSSCPFT